MARLLKRVLVLAVLVAVGGAVVYVTAMPAVQKQAAGRRAKMLADAPVPVVDAPARIADMPVYLNGVGTARARNTVTVRPQVDGKILSIKFREGQEVKRGDVLALIDPATYQAQLDQAKAKKALDEAQLANAQRDLARYAQLAANVVAQKTIDTQRALVEQFTAQLKLDDAAIANAQAYLDYTTIVAPIDGRTGIRMVDEGNLVRASDAGIVMITEIKPIAVIYTLPQQQLAQINAAQARGTVTVEALDADGKTVIDRGTLQVVDNQVDQTTGTVRMKAEFPNANLQLWPGQFVNVRILTETLSQVVVIPTPAVQRGPNGTFAYVVQDDRVGLRPITVGLQTETTAVITQGHRRRRARRHDGLLPSQGRRARRRGAGRGSAGRHPRGGQGCRSAAATAKSEAREKMRTACAADLQKFCPKVERGGTPSANACRRTPPSFRRAARPPVAGQKGGKAREADARKLEGSSPQ